MKLYYIKTSEKEYLGLFTEEQVEEAIAAIGHKYDNTVVFVCDINNKRILASTIIKFVDASEMDFYEILRILDVIYDKTEGIVETQESIREFLCSEAIPNRISCSKLLESLEDNTATQFFEFDFNDSINVPAKPLYTTEDLINAVFPEIISTKKGEL